MDLVLIGALILVKYNCELGQFVILRYDKIFIGTECGN
jgi:hypothetical protein